MRLDRQVEKSERHHPQPPWGRWVNRPLLHAVTIIKQIGVIGDCLCFIAVTNQVCGASTTTPKSRRPRLVAPEEPSIMILIS